MMLSLSSLLSDPLVRRFFSRLALVFVLLSGLVSISWYAYGEIDKELKAQEKPKIQKLNSLRSQVRFLQQQVRLYEKYGEKYQELVKKGLVKKQDRVFWTDSLIKLSQTYAIPSLKFSFSPEKPLSSGQFSHIKIPNGFFFFSRVQLSMDLQHEEDLLRLFESISEQISPLYLVESCKTKLLDSDYEISANFDAMKGNVSTECSLIVFHTHPKEKSKGGSL